MAKNPYHQAGFADFYMLPSPGKVGDKCALYHCKQIMRGRGGGGGEYLQDYDNKWYGIVVYAESLAHYPYLFEYNKPLFKSLMICK